MGIVVAALLAGSLLAAIVMVVQRLATRFREARPGEKPGGGSASGGSPRRCPLCDTELAPGERVASRLYPGKGDRIMHIFGCAHCWPATSSAAPRRCPVCGKDIDAEGWVVARYFSVQP